MLMCDPHILYVLLTCLIVHAYSLKSPHAVFLRRGVVGQGMRLEAEAERSQYGTDSEKKAVVPGSGKWSPLKPSSSTPDMGFEGTDDEEDPYMDPFFTSAPGSSDGSSGEWGDWDENEGAYFDDEDDQDRGYGLVKRGGGSNLFLSRDDYASIVDRDLTMSTTSTTRRKQIGAMGTEEPLSRRVDRLSSEVAQLKLLSGGLVSVLTITVYVLTRILRAGSG